MSHPASLAASPRVAVRRRRRRARRGYWSGVLPPPAARSGDDGLRRPSCSLIVLIARLRALAAPADPYKTSMLRRLNPLGSPGYLLGTDELGRDMLSRLIYGGRLSLFMGVTPVPIALRDRRPARHHRGLRGRRGSTWLIMRTMDVFYAFPSVLLADLAVGRAGRRASTNALLSLTLVFIPPIARVPKA